MALIAPDFSDSKDRIEAGTYKVRIKGSDLDSYENAKGKIVPVVIWKLETFGEADPKNNGRGYSHRTPAAGGGVFLLENFYAAAMGKRLDRKGGGFNTDDLLGREVEIEIVDGVNRQTGEPTGYTEVKSVRSLGSN